MVGREASGCLVAPAVFKTDVAEDLGQAGSIPVRLRSRLRRSFVGSPGAAAARARARAPLCSPRRHLTPRPGWELDPPLRAGQRLGGRGSPRSARVRIGRGAQVEDRTDDAPRLFEIVHPGEVGRVAPQRVGEDPLVGGLHRSEHPPEVHGDGDRHRHVSRPGLLHQEREGDTGVRLHPQADLVDLQRSLPAGEQRPGRWPQDGDHVEQRDRQGLARAGRGNLRRLSGFQAGTRLCRCRPARPGADRGEFLFGSSGGPTGRTRIW